MHESVPPRLSDLAERLAEGDTPEGGERADDQAPAVLVLGAPAVQPSPASGDLLATSSRRAFLARASTLSLALPGLGAALTACSPGGSSGGGGDSAQAGGKGALAGGAQDSLRHHNSDSRLDTAVLKGARHGSSSATPGATQGASAAPYHRYDPAPPPLPRDRTLRLNWRAMEVPVRIRPDTVVAAWTFEGNVPGPIVHCRVGDTVEFTLTTRAWCRTRWTSTRRRSTPRSRSGP
jgi:hypothetical protein